MIEGRALDAQGGTVTFESLLASCAVPAFQLAWAMLGDAHDAEDAVQEAAVRAWTRFRGWRHDATFRTWFLAIVANQCRSMRRTAWWRLRMTVELPEVRLRGHEDLTVSRLDLASLLDRLPREQQALVYLYFELDLPQAEIAGILGIRTATVKTRLHRLVTRLRRTMEEDTTR